MNEYMKNCFSFRFKFETIKEKIKGELYSSSACSYIFCDIGELTDLIICTDYDHIEFEEIFLGSKKSFEDIKVGDVIGINNTAAKITEIVEYTSIKEMNDFYDRIEQEELLYY